MTPLSTFLIGLLSGGAFIMKKMKTVLYYFSSTGNTRRLCQWLQATINSTEIELIDIADCAKPQIDDYDIVGFASYCQMLGANKKVLDFIGSLNGSNKPAFILSTFGMMNGNTLGMMSKAASLRGFKVFHAHALNCPESFPPMIHKGQGMETKPEASDMKALRDFADSFEKSLNQYKDTGQLAEKKVPISMLNSLFSKLASLQKMGAKTVDRDKCTKCGACQQNCVYQCITTQNGYPVFDEAKCQECYSCFNNCKVGAINTPKLGNNGRYLGNSEMIEVMQQLKV